MITIRHMRRAIRLYKNPWIEKRAERYNQTMYLRALAILGDRWVLAKQQERIGG